MKRDMSNRIYASTWMLVVDPGSRILSWVATRDACCRRLNLPANIRLGLKWHEVMAILDHKNIII
jgi:hypothetical protein